MKINNGSQNLKKFVKQTKTSRGMSFAFQGPIFRLCNPKKVRNCFPIFIHHMMSLYRDNLKLIQVISQDMIFKVANIVITLLQ